MAHLVVQLVARLSVYSSGGQPIGPVANAGKSLFDNAYWWPLAWCRLAVCGLGGLHGLFLSGEHLARKWWGDRPAIQSGVLLLLLAILTQGGVCLAWVFFRAGSFTEAFQLLSVMFRWPVDGLSEVGLGAVRGVVVFAGMWLLQWRWRDTSLKTLSACLPMAVRVGLLVSLLLAIILESGTEHAFIYFQF